MDIQENFETLRLLTKSNQRHGDYQRTVDIAKEYKAHVSGVGLDDYLRQFNLREDEAMFEQRKRLTNSISKPVAGSIKKPFYKVSRNKNVRSEIEISDKAKLDVVQTMVKNFYGSDELNIKGLDFWLKNRFLELVFVDANAWIVIEWTPKPLTEVLEPIPFEVTSENAVNFVMKNNVLQSLVVRTWEEKISLLPNGDTKSEPIESFTLYEVGSSLKVVEVNKDYFDKFIELQDNQELFVEGVKGKEQYFLATYNESNLDYIPAFRVGYLRDEATDGRTFVSPMDSAIPYFRKALKSVSELDLSITLHTFPQKIQFVSACKYRKQNDRCQDGILSISKTTCPSCSGSGLEVHKSGQDAIFHKMPEDKTDMFDLDKTLVYKTPPIELIKFQNEYVRNLKQDAHLAIFNSTMFISSDVKIAKTATEIDFNMEGVNDTLFPYTEKFSEIWKTIVQICVDLSGYVGDFTLKHIFPADLKLKTTSMLIMELKNANDSNAPSFLIDQITGEIAGQIYNGDELSLKKFETRHKFFPFNGKSKEEIGLLLASPYVSTFTKILYGNFEAIFTDIEKDTPTFYFKNYSQQWDILQKAIQPFIEEIDKQTSTEPFKFDFGNSSAPSEENPTDGNQSDGQENQV